MMVLHLEREVVNAYMYFTEEPTKIIEFSCKIQETDEYTFMGLFTSATILSTSCHSALPENLARSSNLKNVKFLSYETLWNFGDLMWKLKILTIKNVILMELEQFTYAVWFIASPILPTLVLKFSTSKFGKAAGKVILGQPPYFQIFILVILMETFYPKSKNKKSLIILPIRRKVNIY